MMETIDVIITLIYIVLLCFNIKGFMYQRTIRKISIKENIPQDQLWFLYPKHLIILYNIGKLRWAAIGALFYFNRIIAVLCVFLGFVIPLIIPEQDDYKNMDIAKNSLNAYMKQQTLSGKLNSSIAYRMLVFLELHTKDEA